MSTPAGERLRREASRIAMWARGGQAPPREVLAKLGPPGSGERGLDYGGQEKGVGNSYGADDSELPDLGPLASFGSWQSVASTILRKAEDSVGFDQSSTEFDLCEWISLGWQFADMPFLADIIDDSRYASISSLSLWPAIEAIYYSIEFDGVVPMDAFDGIVTSVKKIGQLAVQNEGRQEKDSNMQQGVLTVVNGDLRLGLLRTGIQMEYRTGKGYQQLNQQIDVSRLFGSLDYDMCVRHAGTLLEWDGRDVDDWVNDASSSSYPPNTSPAWDI
ncbi:hypothetical protein [Streptomyces sp. NPDC000134]|uniref:hypothetical protein n=1 Tax=Streptomyces sp. NPDC000134 TaxID=3364536 RepID=UPI0036991EF8